MNKKPNRTRISRQRALAGPVLALLALMTYCRSGNTWTEVQSFTFENKTTSSGDRLRLEPVDDGKGLIKNIGVFEATFHCARLKGQEEFSYKTESVFRSKAGRKGGLAVDQRLSSLMTKKWPAGAGTQEVGISCPFLPWEIKSSKVGDVYFYVRDVQDGAVVSNIIVIPVNIKAR